MQCVFMCCTEHISKFACYMLCKQFREKLRLCYFHKMCYQNEIVIGTL